MAKQLNVNLAFTADTGKAKAQLQDLQNTLNSLVMNKNLDLGLTDDIMQATQAAAQLKVQLESATNPNTGLLDLSKFSETLTKSGMSLKQYQAQLSALGPAGDQAFSQLAQSIMTAEVPMRRMGALASGFWTTLKNTARWQLSSSVLHGFMGGLQTAYGYAQDLNESLNNIRIVTGYGADQMAEFAIEANKAAKALSTTTTEYTNASLIYYQQGLSDDEVLQRTDITIKMANVARESAEVVSDQMTAIWNNFYDGSKSLEYYADVMTALGATTASSTDEIAEGLEKFAAIADSVGLSYEYATAALATVTATTRQSADVVGTAFKTLFARIQDLELGETLDDGVTLGKYSEALDTVGVDILDANKNLRDMDDILNDLGVRWDSLAQSEKVSVAQTVAGVRQYTQLMALMDNWDYFQENLGTAEGATGALNEQAKIYAESWEAASNRVTAAAEAIYDALLDDEFFIDLANFGADALGTIDSIIDSLGGFKGVVLTLGTVIMTVFQNQIANSLSNMAYSIKMLTKAGQEAVIARKNEANEALINASIQERGAAGQGATTAYQMQGAQQNAYLQNAKKLNEEEQKTVQLLMDRNRLLGESLIKAGELVDKTKQQADQTQRTISAQIKAETGIASEDLKTQLSTIRTLGEQYGRMNSVQGIFNKAFEGNIVDVKLLKNSLTEVINQIDKTKANGQTLGEALRQAFGQNGAEAIEAMIKSLNNGSLSAEELERQLRDIDNAWNLDNTMAELFETSLKDLREELIALGVDEARAEEMTKKLRVSFQAAGSASGDFTLKAATLKSSVESLITTMKGAENAAISMSSVIVQMGTVFMSIGMVLSSIKGIIDTFNNDEATTSEKVIALLTGLGMLIPTIKTLGGAFIGLNAQVTVFNTTLGITAGYLYSVVIGIAAAVAAIAIIIKMIDDFYNKESLAFEKAKEDAEAVKKAYDDVKNSFDELKNSINDYEEALISIAKLTEGTDEWKDAIVEANNQARRLIDTYDELAGQYTYNAETGLIEFNNDALDDLLNSKTTNLNNAYNANLIASSGVLAASSANSVANLAKLNDKDNDYDEFSYVRVLKPYLPSTYGDKLADAIINQSEIKSLSKALEDGILDEEELESLSKSLNTNETQLLNLANEVKANTYATIQNNKEILNNTLNDNYKVQNSQEKDFLLEIMGSDLKTEADRLYDEVYRNKWMTDKDAQKAYADAMGLTHVKDKGNNMGVYANSEGEEITISDETARRFLANQEALKQVEDQTESYLEKVQNLKTKEKELANQYSDGALSLEEYENSLIEYGKTLELTKDEVDKFALAYGQSDIQRARREEAFYTTAANTYGLKKGSITGFDSFLSNLSDEQLEIAIDVMGSTDSIDEFVDVFQQKLQDAYIASFQSSTITVTEILANSIENTEFSSEDLNRLENDENFIEWLKANNMAMRNLTMESYSAQYAIISQYYADLQKLSYQALEDNKKNYEEDLLKFQTILDYKRALAAGEGDEAARIQSEYGDEIDFEAYLDMDISDVETKIDLINAEIESISDQQIELNMSWDGVDQVEQGLKKIGQFTNTIEKDTKKVGNNYLLTAAQAREWIEIYPELFEQASVTKDGLIQINEADYLNFKETQEGKQDNAIEALINVTKAKKQDAETQKELLETDLELFKLNEEGKIDLSGASAQTMSETRSKLVQYFIDSGYDEVDANEKALEVMQVDQDEYDAVIASSIEGQTNDVIDAAKEGSEKSISWWEKFKVKALAIVKIVGTGLSLAMNNDIAGMYHFLWGEGEDTAATLWDEFKNPEKYISTKITDGGKFTSSYNSGGYNSYKFDSVSGYARWLETYLAENPEEAYAEDLWEKYEASKEYSFTPSAYYEKTYGSGINTALEEVYNSIVAERDTLDKSIDSLQNQITYLEALKAQSLENYGATDAEDILGKMSADLEKVYERYHEINREIAFQERALERISKAKDKAYGGNKLKLIQQEQKELSKLYDLEETLYNASGANLILDKAAVQKQFANATFDTETGEITNYTDLLREATNNLNVAKTNAATSQSKADEEALEQAQKIYDEQIRILEQYETTLDLWQDQADRLNEIQAQIKASNYELLNTRLEVKLELNDATLEEIEYNLNKVADDFYSMAEGAELLNSQIPLMNSNLGAYDVYFSGLTAKYKMGKIEQADYVAGLQTAYSGILSQLEALNDLDKEMMNYYGETLSMANEELDKYTNQMSHLTSVLDHYRSIVELINGEYDYEAIGNILEGRVGTLKNEMSVSIAWYNTLKEQKASLEKELATATTTEQKELIQRELDEITANLIEAEDEMLSKTKEWAQATKDVMENTFAEAAKIMEDSLTNNIGFDALDESLSRLSEYQDIYLTKTNQIYETEKLMREAQQAADKSQNAATKQRLSNFVKETEGLKDKTKLSNLELEIQKAKYDLLLAEIALEEAQNAKSTVRLQRDSNGNFGYVYTSDAEAIAEAEQDLADAQNSLYNIALEGANENGQKLLELQQRVAQDLIAIEEARAAGQYATDEEYYAARDRIINEYTDLFKAYSADYTLSLETDVGVQQDAWVLAYEEMISETDKWKTKVEEYTGNCETAYETWRTTVESESKIVDEVLNNTAQEVKDITDESDKLAKTAKEKVIPALNAELNATRNATSAYAAQRREVQLLITEYEKLARAILEAMAAQGGADYDYSGDYSMRMAQATIYGDEDYYDQTMAEREVVYNSDLEKNNQYITNKDWDKALSQYGGDNEELNEYIENVAAGKQYISKEDLEKLGVKFKTGGYTGDWGIDSKLAWLHEKELVLNQDDTSNFLSAIGMIRDIVRMIDIEALRNQFTSIMTPMFSSSGAGDILEQMVQIEAHFPNVTDRNEVEEALKNLINTSSQYANRKQ